MSGAMRTKEAPAKPPATALRLAAASFPKRGRRPVQLLKANALSLVLGCVILGLLIVCGLQLTRLAGCTAGWSLRYPGGISAQAAAAARHHAAENPEDSLWPTFWREDTLSLKNELAQSTSRGLWYSGEGALVWPARFVRGGWPGATDTAGCVVSKALAWQLFGSYDVIGKSVDIDGKPCFVRGVFEGDSPLCLLPTSDDSTDIAWQGVEFRAEDGVQKSDVETFARASGLGEAGSILSGDALFSLGLWLVLLPLLLPALWLLCRWVLRLTKSYPAPAKILLVLLLLVLALCLPQLLGLLPVWVIPSRWSDFSHWAALWGRFSAFIDVLIGMAPALRDVAMKRCLLALLACGCMLGPLCFWLAGRLPSHKPPSPAAHRPSAT